MTVREPIRYQLKKETESVVRQGHPWIFRNRLSTAAEIFKTGDWLALYGTQNEVLGYGVFDREGLIAVRVMKPGRKRPSAEYFRAKFEKNLAKREALRKFTNSFRALHGENDGVPGVVLDVYGKVGVLQTYSPSVDRIGRYASLWFAKALGLESILWKIPAKSGKANKENTSRWIRGQPVELQSVTEGKLRYCVPLAQGQKSGAFLDLRGLRKWLALGDLKGKRVLNLFSYTGTLGLAAELGGATEIWNVDISEQALEFSKRHNALKKEHHRYVTADIFDWLAKLPAKEKFDVIIVDPPQMTSRMTQVEKALATYDKLYRSALEHLAPQGVLIGCCCTSRISRPKFRNVIDRAGNHRLRHLKALGPEDDHPVAFEEGDYLKILIYQGQGNRRNR